MAQHIQEILNTAIKHGGSTIDNFTHLHVYEKDENSNIIKADKENEKNILQDNGYFQIRHKVYGKQNQKCTFCDGIISKITQGQRSTYYCLTCQSK
jgi:formamidopyrimidine-DNA glycosylase